MALLTWEKNRVADIIKPPSGSPHLTNFWVPIPLAKHGYVLHLRVLDHRGVPLDEMDAVPEFR
jgi:hypothetical protein